LAALLDNPPLMYVKVDNKDIAVRNKITQFLNWSDRQKGQKLEEYFPIQFKVYKEQGEVPPPTTFRNEIWILQFRGNEFVSREIVN